jgi:serine/threonine protein kinase
MFVCPECGLGHPHAGHCPHDGTALAPRGDDPLIGETLGAYRVAGLLGVGGMGRVYKGVQPQIGSRVAIKVLSHECAQRRDLVERFFSEARAVNLIRHESIVNVLDLATLPDGRPFIIMEYLDGAPLSAIVERTGPLPLGSLARLIAEVLDALGAAHGKGVVHRDLKPDNVFVTPAGRPKVLDFGIAKLHQTFGPGTATQTGSLLGTPHYMAPEQALGRAVDPRTDLYAVGVILFECATGRRPFEASSLYDLLRQHVDEPPPAPRRLRPEMSPAYEEVILRALAKDPAQRWQHSAALVQALQHATQGLPPAAWTTISAASRGAAPTPGPPGSWPRGPASWPGMQGPTHPDPTPLELRGPTLPAPPHPGPTTSSGQVMAPPPPRARTGKGLVLGIVLGVVIAGGASAGFLASRAGSASSARTTGAATGAEPAVSAEAEAAAADDADDAAAPPSAAALIAELAALEHTAVQEVARLERELTSALERVSGTPAPAATPNRPTSTAPPTAAPPTPTPAPAPSPTPAPTAAAPPAATAPPPATAPPRTPPSRAAVSLDRPISLPVPPGFDPGGFDVSAYYPTAEAEARRIWSDARLVRIDADAVRPSGLAELTLGDRYYVRYWFRSEQASEPPADLPIGVEHKAVCNLQIWVDRSGVRLLPMSWDCDPILVPRPRCTVAQAWAKAIEAGAPGDNAVAQISYMANIVSKQVRWSVTIGKVFSKQLPDGC